MQQVIGMFDSGVGGLTVMKEILAQLPEVRIIYFGDTARVPYGNRSREELIRFGEEIISFLINQGAQAIVVACNTSSANAVPVLKEHFQIPLIGTIEPGARAAVSATVNGKIGLIATEATVRSKAYNSAVRRVLGKGGLPGKTGDSIELVKAQACPLFVPLVEAGLSHSPEARGIARTYLAPIQEAEVDALILGCTHYPFLAPVIREILGEKIALVDPAQAMVGELKDVLERLSTEEVKMPSHRGDTVSNLGQGKHSFFVSGDPALFEQVGNTLLPGQIFNVKQISWKE